MIYQQPLMQQPTYQQPLMYPSQMAYQQPIYQQPLTQPPMQQEEGLSGLAIFGIVIVIIIILVVIGISIYYLIPESQSLGKLSDAETTKRVLDAMNKREKNTEDAEDEPPDENTKTTVNTNIPGLDRKSEPKIEDPKQGSYPPVKSVNIEDQSKEVPEQKGLKLSNGRIPLDYMKNTFLYGFVYQNKNDDGSDPNDPNKFYPELTGWEGVKQGKSKDARAVNITADANKNVIYDNKGHIVMTQRVTDPNKDNNRWNTSPNDVYLIDPTSIKLDKAAIFGYQSSDNSLELKKVLGSIGMAFDGRDVSNKTAYKSDKNKKYYECHIACRNDPKCAAAAYAKNNTNVDCYYYPAGSIISSSAPNAKNVSTFIPPKDNLDILLDY